MFKQVFTSSRNTSLIQVYEGVRVQHTPDGQSDAPVAMFKTLVSSKDITITTASPVLTKAVSIK